MLSSISRQNSYKSSLDRIITNINQGGYYDIFERSLNTLFNKIRI